ncbi:Uncharacterized oxidoreductase Mkms_1985 [Serendipita indica DSM 11827]|nr:Uncharacterized oxidoreductase Mkms_1985 [Serendipita indica DSM 11827]
MNIGDMPLSLNSTVTLRSGRAMPLLGLGVYQNTGPTATTACAAAFRAGYRHVDSAQVYRNETEVGQAVKESGLVREMLFITSKINSRNHGYEKTLTWIDQSLRNFGLEYMDLFLIHDPLSGKERRLDTWKALIKARDDGKIKSIGVSNYGVRHLEEIKSASLELPAVNQIELHPFCQQRPIVQWCKDNNIVVQAYCPIMRGQRWDNPVFKELSLKYGKEVPQILIRWSLQKGFSPLPKSIHDERIRSNANVYDFAIDDADMEKLDSLDLGDMGAVSWNPIHAP